MSKAAVFLARFKRANPCNAERAFKTDLFYYAFYPIYVYARGAVGQKMHYVYNSYVHDIFYHFLMIYFIYTYFCMIQYFRLHIISFIYHVNTFFVLCSIVLYIIHYINNVVYCIVLQRVIDWEIWQQGLALCMRCSQNTRITK